MSGCTAFGWGNDEDIRDEALWMLGNESHDATGFCSAVYDYAGTFLTSALVGVFSAATVNGGPATAVSTYSSLSWQSAWVYPGIRDESFSIADRAEWLKDTALHE